MRDPIVQSKYVQLGQRLRIPLAAMLPTHRQHELSLQPRTHTGPLHAGDRSAERN